MNELLRDPLVILQEWQDELVLLKGLIDLRAQVGRLPVSVRQKSFAQSLDEELGVPIQRSLPGMVNCDLCMAYTNSLEAEKLADEKAPPLGWSKRPVRKGKKTI
jgi:hypothetical protein